MPLNYIKMVKIILPQFKKISEFSVFPMKYIRTLYFPFLPLPPFPFSFPKKKGEERLQIQPQITYVLRTPISDLIFKYSFSHLLNDTIEKMKKRKQKDFIINQNFIIINILYDFLVFLIMKPNVCPQ